MLPLSLNGRIPLQWILRNTVAAHVWIDTTSCRAEVDTGLSGGNLDILAMPLWMVVNGKRKCCTNKVPDATVSQVIPRGKIRPYLLREMDLDYRFPAS